MDFASKKVKKVRDINLTQSGIRYQLDAFRNELGGSRILSIWDQTIQTGEPPEGFLYRTEYTREDIDRALQSQNPLDVVPTTDENGHGTAMASTAAGSILDQGLTFRGAAPEAEIAVVKLEGAKQYLWDYYLIADDAIAYQENDIMEAVKYLEQMAIVFQRPVVIVLGIGTNMGDHIGNFLLASYLNKIAVKRSRARIYAGISLVEKRSGNELVFLRFQNPTPGIWTIIVNPSEQERIRGSGCFHIWLPITDFIDGNVHFLEPSPNVTLTEPSNAQDVITVSAYNGVTGSWFSESGRGFTADNRVKPDFAVPGVHVSTILGNRTGSSMAAALTAGCVAQFMEWSIVEGYAPLSESRNIKSQLIRGAVREGNVTYPDESITGDITCINSKK